MLPGRQLTLDTVRSALLRWRWLVIVPLFVGLVGGLLASRFLPSRYRSDALIQIVPQRVPETYVSATVTERVEDRLRAISQQVLSRTQLEKLIVEHALFSEERRAAPMEDVVQLMHRRVTIEPVVTARTSSRDNGADAFRVSFEYEDPVIAQRVVERLASFYIDTNARERGTQAEQTSAFLEAQLADARTRLEAQELRLKVFREQNAGRLPTQMQANMQAIQNAQLALQATVESVARDRDRKLILERLYAEASAESDPAVSASAGPAGAGADPIASLPTDVSPSQRLAVAERTLAQMESRLSAKHPDVLRLRRMIEELRQQVETVAQQRPLSADEVPERPITPEDSRRRAKLREQLAEIESLDRQIAFKVEGERRLRAQIIGYQNRLEAVPGIESEWVALTRDYDTLQATYRDLLAKSENSRMAASLEQRQIGEQFRILDPPHVPERPYSPNRARINLSASAMGLGLGLALVVLAFLHDSTMRTEADVLNASALPVLALVPYVTTDADKRRDRRRRHVELLAGSGILATLGVLVVTLRLWRYIL